METGYTGNLTTLDLEKFLHLGIPPDLLVAAQIERATDREAREKYGMVGHGDLGGIVFPYFDPVSGQRWTARLRRDHPEIDTAGNSHKKYLSAYGDRSHLFFPPRSADLLRDPSVLIVFVEAEKSVLALVAWAVRTGRTVLPIGLGGCWGWKGRIGKIERPDGVRVDQMGPLHDLGCASNGRRAIVMLDTNVAHNPDVKRAERALVLQLERQEAAVRVARLPVVDQVNGPDDLIGVCGDDAMAVALDQARPTTQVARAEAEEQLKRLDADPDLATLRVPCDALDAIAVVDADAERELLISRLAARYRNRLSKATLEAEVAKRRARVTNAALQSGNDVEEKFTEEELSGAGLLQEVFAYVRRFVLLSEDQAITVSLWAMHTHALEAAEYTPYLNVYSATYRSGKTRLLEVLNLVVARPWFTARVSASVLVRYIDSQQPTVLLDEGDTAFSADREYAEALRGVLNAGFERDGCTCVCVKSDGDWEPRKFHVFCAKAIAGIGKLPGTVSDRSIPVGLKRRTRKERLERFRKKKEGPAADRLRRRLAAWAKAHLDLLREAEPALPHELDDRQQDVCEPLLAIADLVGGEWPERARRALVALCTDKSIEDESIAVRLLADIQDAFDNLVRDKLATKDLISALCSDENAPWAGWNRGNAISPSQLAKHLAPFDIEPKTIRFDDKPAKGYEREQFEEVWDRYLRNDTDEAQDQKSTPNLPGSGSEPLQPLQSSCDAPSNSFSRPLQAPAVTPEKYDDCPLFQGLVTDVTAQNTGDGLQEEVQRVRGDL